MLPDDLPQDFMEFNARFGTDEQCREYLFQARWPDGFRCEGCGHGDAYALRTRLVYECTACGKQHSLLAGTLFEQTKTGLARWFLAICLVTSSKGGIAAAELQRQLGFGSYQTAWSWLHKLRKAMVRPDRAPLAGRVEADETYVGGPRPPPPRSPPTAGAVAPACRPRATRTSRSSSAEATRRSGCPVSTSSSASPSVGCWAPTTARSAPSTCRPTSTRTCFGSTAAPPGASATASPGSSSRPSVPSPPPTGPSSPRPAPPEAHGEAVWEISGTPYEINLSPRPPS